METMSFQDHFPGNVCFGCGPANNCEASFHLKSYWLPDRSGTWCRLEKTHACHTGATAEFMHGGNIFTMMDCHAIWTAIAARYEFEKREFACRPFIWYVTGTAQIVRYIKPVPMSAVLEVKGRITCMRKRKCYVVVEFFANGMLCALGRFIAVRAKFSDETLENLAKPQKTLDTQTIS